MFGWIPFVILLFRKFEARQAAAIAFVAGWMFLPVAALNLPGLPDYTKTTAVCAGILAGAYLFDKERFSNFRFSAHDIPMLLWCIAPFFSSVANGLGPYDGLSQTMYQAITWGLPYYIARVYFSDFGSMKLLALAIFIGAVAYIPFCWFELIMSPQLHRLTYGYHQSNFLQTLRDGGGFRPMVYMEHGLMTAMWMVLGVFLGTWLLYCKELPGRLLFVPTRWLLLGLIFTVVMMKSVGAIVLLLIGLAIVYLSQKMKNTVLVVVMLCVPLLYTYTRTTGIWDGKNLSGFVAEKFSATRAQSLQFRFDNETILIDKALSGTFFGWGGYGRSRVYSKSGKDISITDGLWIITLGQNGIYGLVTMFVAIQMPALLFIRRVKPELWSMGAWGAPAVMAIFMGIYMIDNLLNGMINPIYMLFNGGIVGLLVKDDAVVDLSGELQELIQGGERSAAFPITRFISAAPQVQSRFIS
ncbi:MAG: hypothetical protein HGA56_06760 [Chlorobiaceae bacterium]|nr:hypothetical protein [Chlorobiaceae bacterium]